MALGNSKHPMNHTTTTDYFAVYVKRAPKDKPRFMCNVEARDKRHALDIARSQGLPVPRFSTASRIGRAGYQAALRAVFPPLNAPVSCSTQQ